MRGELSYISETIAIEEFFQITKQAGLLESVFTSASDAIKTYVLDNVDSSSPGALLKSVVRLLEPAILFRIYKPLGLLATVAQTFGISLTDIISSVTGPVINSLNSGHVPNIQDINGLTNSLITTSQLRQHVKIARSIVNQDIVKNAQYYGRYYGKKGLLTGKQQVGGNVLFPGKNPLLYRVFGARGKKGAVGLITAIIAWLVKTILGSVGLLTVGGIAKSKVFDFGSGMLGSGSSEPKGGEPTATALPGGGFKSFDDAAKEMASVVPLDDLGRELSLPSSGAGSQWHKNDADTAWVVPLLGDIRRTLLLWGNEIYPDFKGYEHEISRLPSFNKIVSILEREFNPSKPKYLIIPPGFNRRVDIVNTFAKDAVKLIESDGNEE